MKELPIIELSKLAHPQTCNGCGTTEKPTRRYNLRTGPTNSFTIAWCDLCAKKVTLFLFEMTIEKAQ